MFQITKLFKCLNKNLISIKLTFFQPISFLLYIGKKFENLQTLDVGFFGEEFNSEEGMNFTKLNGKSLSVFKNL